MHNDHGNWVLTSTQRALARWMLDRAALIGVRGFGRVEPNPMVGCVIARTLTDDAVIPADASSLILGRGYHRLFGGPHAEAEAIADARAKGHELQGSTAYVTLEPCNSKGRNPACVDGLLQAGVARVVYARRDPHPLTPGSKSGGAQRLMRSGVKVALTTISPAATALAESFITRIQRATSPHEAARPYTIVKWAQSLDGRMTASSGASQWITGPRARRYAHVLRASCDVIVTSARVVIDDDAQMTARNVVQKRAAARVILDSDGSLLREVAHRQASCRPTLRLLESLSHSQAGPVAVVLGPAATTDRAASRAAEHLTTLGVSIIDGTPWSRPASNTNSHWFDLASILNQLSSGAWWAKPEQQVSQIMFEAGPSMTSSLLQANLADEAWVFIAPKLLGGHGSKGPLELAAIDTPANALPWRCILRKPCGDDQLLILRPDHPHQ